MFIAICYMQLCTVGLWLGMTNKPVLVDIV